jgi:cold shock CspA family protein
MANSFNKRELEKKKEQKRKEKQQRKEERKAGGSKSLDDMIAYVDENGVITSTPPDPAQKQEVELEDISVSTPKREELEEAELKGRVEYFNADKGYGFIKNLSGTEKYFFHITNAPTSIAEGNIVTFELGRGEKGLSAVKITFASQVQ